MSLTSLISTIATAGGNVTGITSSFDADDTPDVLDTAALPALLHFSIGGLREEGTFGRGMWGIRHRIRVRLVYSPAAEGRLEDNIGGIITTIDNYISEMRADSTLDDCYDFVQYGEPGTFEFAGVGFHGVDFICSVLEHVGS